MVYQLDFDERALKEWRKLGSLFASSLKRKLLRYLKRRGLKQTDSAIYLIATKSNCALQVIALSTR